MSHALVHALLSQSGARKTAGTVPAENMALKTNAAGELDFSHVPIADVIAAIGDAFQPDMLMISWFLGGA